MTNWSCCFVRCKGSETPSKPQQSMMQTAGTCGQVHHGSQPGARGRVLRRPLPADLIQCSKVEPNHWISQATLVHSGIARRGKPRRQKKEVEANQRPVQQSQYLDTFFPVSFSHLYINRGNAANSTFYSSSDFPSTTLPFAAS